MRTARTLACRGLTDTVRSSVKRCEAVVCRHDPARQSHGRHAHVGLFDPNTVGRRHLIGRPGKELFSQRFGQREPCRTLPVKGLDVIRGTRDRIDLSPRGACVIELAASGPRDTEGV